MTREAPGLDLELAWVHGMNVSCNGRVLLGTTEAAEIVYGTATMGVLLDPHGHTQRHYRSHQDRITRFACSVLSHEPLLFQYHDNA
jgi:hypothetical protein